jgi:hypothetical protein
MLELVRGLLISREVLRPSEPHLSLYSTRTKLGSNFGAKLTLSSHLLSVGVGGIYMGVKSACWAKVELRGPTCQAGWHRLGPGFLPHHLPVSYYLRLPVVFVIMKICLDFGPYDAIPSSDVPEMGDKQNS